jgi:hypothetical protein
MGVPFVNYLKPEVSTIENVRPGIDYMALAILNALIKVQTVQIKGHRANSQSSKPNANNRPSSKEEMKTARVVEGGVLEDESSEVAVCGNDVVGFLFLSKFVTIVLRLIFGSLTNQGRGYKRTVHCREERTTKHTGYPQHMEGVHQDVVLSLEDKHVVESSRDAERHTIRERTLTKRINQEHCGSGSYGGRIRYTNPGAHTKTVRQFPLTTHIAEHADQEVEHYELVRTTIIEPFIETSGFPDRIKVEADGVGGGHNSTRDDVVTVHERTSNWFADAVAGSNKQPCFTG